MRVPVMRALRLGFSIIEVLISLLILGILLALAAPTFGEWLQNQQIRAAAEATINGMQVARGEAVKLNTNVTFTFMTDLTATCAPPPIGSGGYLTSISWVVSVGDATNSCDKRYNDPLLPTPGPVLQSRAGEEVTPNARVTTEPAGTTAITFTPLGGTANNPDGSLKMTAMTLTSASLDSSPAVRRLRIVINPGGSLRMCDPLAVAPDSRACP